MIKSKSEKIVKKSVFFIFTHRTIFWSLELYKWDTLYRFNKISQKKCCKLLKTLECNQVNHVYQENSNFAPPVSYPQILLIPLGALAILALYLRYRDYTRTTWSSLPRKYNFSSKKMSLHNIIVFLFIMYIANIVRFVHIFQNTQEQVYLYSKNYKKSSIVLKICITERIDVIMRRVAGMVITHTRGVDSCLIWSRIWIILNTQDHIISCEHNSTIKNKTYNRTALFCRNHP